LPALTFYMLLEFRMEAGITGACILSAGIIVLLITVTHTLLRVSRLSRHSHPKAADNLYQNDSAQHGESSGSDGAAPQPRPELHRALSFPVFLEHNSQLGSGASSSSGSPGPRCDRDSSELPRRHRTLSAESSLLRAQLKPWNVVTQEMRDVMSYKARAAGKDATLV
ncbi:TM221 protein, partial [Calyptomena viridis]|nr:TM221 protein [Calyptomena viridis]